MSKEALQLLVQVFGNESNIGFPPKTVEQVLEIRKFVAEELAKLQPDENQQSATH